MKNPQSMIPFTFLLLALAAMPMAQAAGHRKAEKAVTAPTPQSTLREVEYTDLENRIGAKLVIRTTNDTTRKGELVRYTNVTLTLQLGPENGAIELAVPRDTIRKVMIEIGPADPLFLNEKTPQKGDAGAKKN